MDPPRRQRWEIQVQKEPGASLRRDSEELWQLADRRPGVKLTCQDDTAANVGTAAAARGGGGKRRAARPASPPRVPITPAPLPLAPLRGCSLLTLGADARDTAKNKKKGPASPQTGLLRGAQQRSGAWEAEPGGSGRPREGGSSAGRCGAGLVPAPVKGCGPGASRGRAGVSGARRGVLGRGPGAVEGQGERRGPGRPGGEPPGTRAACSPPAAAPAVARRCGGPAPRSPGQLSRRRRPRAPVRPGQRPAPPRSRPPQRRVPASGQRPRRAEEAASGARGGEAGTAPGLSAPQCARPGPRPRSGGSWKSLVAPPLNLLPSSSPAAPGAPSGLGSDRPAERSRCF